MADLKITDVPQGSSVSSTDDLYIKTGSNFRRVPVSKLVTLLNTQGFYQKGLNGIPTTDLAEEQVVISPDGSGYVSSKTYSQISAAVEAGSAIHPEFRPDGSTYLRGMVLDILDSSALFAFLVPGTGPHISIFNVTDLSVTETRIPVSGQPCRAVCNTEEETTAKTAEVQGAAGDLFSLYDGATVYVYFTNGASPGSTLNVNNTGAKLIDFGGAGEISAGTYAQLFYQEALGCWIFIGGNSVGSSLTDELKTALLNWCAHTAWNDTDGQTRYNAMYDALYPAPGPATLVSITADYEQDRPIYDTDDLDAIKAGDDLTVTANYSDGTSVVLDDDDYELTGTLTVGTSTITVSYEGKTTTISVLVTQTVVGWYYQFNNSIVSSGTKDFGFAGVENYTTGVNGQAYWHKVTTEGTSSTDVFGIKAVGLSDVPDMSGDFTISLWHKSITQTKGHLLCATKYESGQINTSSVSVPTVVKTGWSAASAVTLSKAYKGVRVGYISSKFQCTLFATDGTAIFINLSLPNTIDTTQFHHHAITRKNGVIRYFFDGELICTINNNKTLVFPDQVCIGNYFNQGGSNVTDLVATEYADIVDDLYISESCKWDADFDISNITY